jgi:Cu+-exporting ATPase
VQSLLLDKTGTLTEGRPRVVGINALDQWEENEILQYAATLEKNSAHPLAVAIVDAIEEKNISLSKAEAIASVSGGGIEGVVNGRKIHIGKIAWLEASGIEIPENIRQEINGFSEEGRTCALIAVDGILSGYLVLSDPIKKGARGVIKNLHAMGLKLIILTGDSEGAAKATAEELGIEEYYGDLVPEEKNAFVKRMKDQQLKVAMAGDGVNDAPALTEADVGIAMGKGSDIAIESAGITLLNGDLSGIEKAFRISRYTLRNIRQNLFFAFFYNGLSIPIAAGILYPFFGFLLNPMIAGAVMSMSSLSVVINALRLRKVDL